ncbi:MAG: helix-turn-helix transcriptional regulator [Firmicutes bacterium]|nr:helix-turn-helix transcriptional regulator [Bacillota bacterium]
MSEIDDLIREEMADPEFKLEWEESEFEDQLRRMLIAARISCNMTQEDLSARAGIRQSNISRIENGSCIPTLTTLNAIAKGLGKRLVIEFV